jgi:hypothetical protein
MSILRAACWFLYAAEELGAEPAVETGESVVAIESRQMCL